MGETATIVVASWAAGSTAVIGGMIAWGVGGRGSETRREITHGVVAFGGGIMYLIFQDIAPQAKMRRHWIPALGAVLGFAVGMVGKQLIG